MTNFQEAKVICQENDFFVELPMTSPTGKVRVKKRSHFSEYGIPVAARSAELSQNDYIEWQIGYDLPAKEENEAKTSLTPMTFWNSKEKPEEKFPYGLSEILYYSYQKEWVTEEEIKNLWNEVDSLPLEQLLDRNAEMTICRTVPIEKKINSVDFYAMEVRYPLIVHQFEEYDIYTEVINREKQKGVGCQPMLYLCIPLGLLHFQSPPFGRIAQPKEKARWNIGEKEGRLALMLFRVFGMLTPRHQHDVKAILQAMFTELSLGT